MGLATYTCADDFPPSIPGLLSLNGIKVTEDDEEKYRTPVSFAYAVQRGFGQIYLFGSEELMIYCASKQYFSCRERALLVRDHFTARFGSLHIIMAIQTSYNPLAHV